MGEALTYGSIWVQLVPVVAFVAVRRWANVALTLTAISVLVMLAQDLLMVWFGSRGMNNLWVSHAAMPVTTALILWAYSHWQVRGAPRSAIRVAAALYLLIWVLLSLAAESFMQFSRFTGPMQAILVIAAAGYTLVAHFRETDAPLDEPWFWISLGWVLYFGSGVMHDPISHLLLRAGELDYLRLSYYLKAGINVLAFALLTGGFLCGRFRLRFGGFLSQVPAPLRSSWLRSS